MTSKSTVKGGTLTHVDLKHLEILSQKLLMPTSPVLGDLTPVHSHRENSGARCTLAGHPQLQRGCHSGKVTCGTRDGCR